MNQGKVNQIDPQLSEENMVNILNTENGAIAMDELLQDNAGEKMDMRKMKDMRKMREMKDDPLENLSYTENGALAMDQLVRETEEKEKMDMRDMMDQRAEKERPIVQKRVFSSFNMSHGRSKFSKTT